MIAGPLSGTIGRTRVNIYDDRTCGSRPKALFQTLAFITANDDNAKIHAIFQPKKIIMRMQCGKRILLTTGAV